MDRHEYTPLRAANASPSSRTGGQAPLRVSAAGPIDCSLELSVNQEVRLFIDRVVVPALLERLLRERRPDFPVQPPKAA